MRVLQLLEFFLLSFLHLLPLKRICQIDLVNTHFSDFRLARGCSLSFEPVNHTHFRKKTVVYRFLFFHLVRPIVVRDFPGKKYTANEIYTSVRSLAKLRATIRALIMI